MAIDRKLPNDAAERFKRDVLQRIPLAAAMEIRVADSMDSRLVLAAPLAPNLNHAGTAFGGAIECLGTLACWGLLWFALDAPKSTIVIQRGETDFVAPITGELRAEAQTPGDDSWRRFTEQFAKHGRARITLTATIGDATRATAARFRGRFVATRGPRPGGRRE